MQLKSVDRELEKLINRLIETVKIFHDFTPLQLATLLSKSSSISLRQGDVVVRQGDVGASLFVIASGELSVWDQSELESNGTKLATLLPGETFGEMAFLSSGIRTATVIANSTSHIIEVSISVIQGDMAATLYKNIAKLLSDRLVEANKIISLCR